MNTQTVRPVPKCRNGEHPLNKWAIHYPTEQDIKDGHLQAGERMGVCVNCKAQKIFTAGRLQTESELDEKKWWNK